ncbi:MAG TPA: adenylate/guanylate cyclase domain-containing protein [Stellaceae bacterium]|nr:adenylate/guanylate cyclase domain-containing protein [Stellaceae bacterium]
MSELRIERKLAAILCADVVGYSRMMGADEEGTHAALQRCRREIVDPTIANHKGRIVRTAGDGLLVEFASVVDALRCALAIQDELAAANAGIAEARRIRYRIGITIGDVIADPEGIHGEGVAVASRLESIAEPGGIAVSRTVRDQVPNLLPIRFEDIGEHQAKNVARPVRAYRVVTRRDEQDRPPISAPVPEDKAGLAVLPLQHPSGHPELGFLADSLAEDLITELSRPQWFSVIARNSSFTYKGRVVNAKQISRELGVRYIVEGSVRAADARLRVLCRLVEAPTGSELWSERFEGTRTEELELQDKTVAAVVAAVEPTLRMQEIERARRKPVEQLDLHGACVLALHHLVEGAPEATAARRLAERALTLDRRNPLACALAAWERAQAFVFGRDGASARDEAERLSRSAVAEGGDPPVAAAIAGLVLAMISQERDLARAAADQALAAARQSALILSLVALQRCLCGEAEDAIEMGARAMQASSFEIGAARALLAQAWGALLAGRHAEAAAHARKAIQGRPRAVFAHAALIASLSLARESEGAREAARRLHEAAPGFGIAALERLAPARSAASAPYIEALRQAGVPP